MRKVLKKEQLSLDLLAAVGGVLQESTVLRRVRKDKLSARCGEVIAIAVKIARANGVRPERLMDAVRTAERKFKDGNERT